MKSKEDSEISDRTKQKQANEVGTETGSTTSMIKLLCAAFSKIKNIRKTNDTMAPVKIIQQETIKPVEITYENQVPMAGTGYLNNKSKIVCTKNLASCYALIVIGKTADGTPIGALNHWIGDELSAEDTIKSMTKALKSQGMVTSGMQCFAIGGQKDFSDMTKEIDSLVKRKIIQQAKLEVNNNGENTDLIVRINDNKEISIEYTTRKIHVKSDSSQAVQEDNNDLVATALAALRNRSP
jgi:hypothetical protein